jgi:hypothetical protein
VRLKDRDPRPRVGPGSSRRRQGPAHRRVYPQPRQEGKPQGRWVPRVGRRPGRGASPGDCGIGTAGAVTSRRRLGTFNRQRQATRAEANVAPAPVRDSGSWEFLAPRR